MRSGDRYVTMVTVDSVRGRVLRHRRAGAAGGGQRGLREVRRRPPQHREVRNPAAEDHQAGE